MCQTRNGRKALRRTRETAKPQGLEYPLFSKGYGGSEPFRLGEGGSGWGGWDIKKGISHVVFSYKLAEVLRVFFKRDFSEVCVLSAVMYLSANSSLLAIMYLLALITF